MVTQESKEVYVNEIVAESAIGYCFPVVIYLYRILFCVDSWSRSALAVDLLILLVARSGS